MIDAALLLLEATGVFLLFHTLQNQAWFLVGMLLISPPRPPLADLRVGGGAQGPGSQANAALQAPAAMQACDVCNSLEIGCTTSLSAVPHQQQASSIGVA